MPSSNPSDRMGAAWRLGAVVAILATLPYLNTLSCGFTLDDFPVIVQNDLLGQPFDLGRLFTSNFWGEREKSPQAPAVSERGPELRSLYRPVTAASYCLERRAWRLAPAGYHAVNVALHALVSALVFSIALPLLGSAAGAFSVGALFAVHPIHTEVVASVVGRAELLAAFFFLLALRVSMSGWFARESGPRHPQRIAAWVERGRWAAGAAAIVLLYFLALGSKESAVTLPGVLLAVAVLWPRRAVSASAGGRSGPRSPSGHSLQAPQASLPRRASPRRWTLLFLGLGLALAAFLVLRGAALAPRQFAWSGFLGVSGGRRVLTAIRVLMEYLGLLLWPSRLSADYWLPEVPIARSLLDPAVAASLAVWGGLVAAAVFGRRRRPVLALGIGWFLITILPASNVIFPIGVGKAERLLYLPSIGFCLSAGTALAALGGPARRRAPLVITVALVLAALAMRTWVRNRDWRDNLTLGLATLRTSPTSPLANQIVGVAYRERGEFKRAQPYLETAVRENRPDGGYANEYNLGNNLLSLGRYAEAEQAYLRALTLRPDWLAALNNLGQAQMQSGRNAEAVRTFSRVMALDPGLAGPYLNLGSAYFNLGDRPEAERTFRSGLRVAPADARLHFNLALALRALGRTEEANGERQRAITLDPEAAKWPF